MICRLYVDLSSLGANSVPRRVGRTEAEDDEHGGADDEAQIQYSSRSWMASQHSSGG